jgi:hypothetical protein
MELNSFVARWEKTNQGIVERADTLAAAMRGRENPT